MSNKTEKEILEKIRSGKVKMKPRWWFLSQIIAMRAIYWILILMASLGAAAVAYFFNLYRPTELSEFSELGWWLILEDFPVWGMISLIIGLLTGTILAFNIGENYRKSIKTILIMTVLIVVAMTVGVYLLQIGI